MVFNVSQSDPFITLPREVARLINVDVCQRPIAVQNEFFEFLEFGVGLQPNDCGCQYLQMYDRGVFPTFADIAAPNKTVRVFMVEPADAQKRTLIQGLDANGVVIRSQDGLTPTLGEFLTLQDPFVQAPMEISSITGIQKDVTLGPVKYYEVDLTTGDTRLLLTMEPSEQSASYRRYTINGLPRNCCNTTLPTTTQVTGMAKLEFIPVRQDTDYLLIQNIEALASECQAIRFDGMDSPNSDRKAAVKHREAIGYLNGELTHYLGALKPAVVFAPFGSARLERRGIGLMT